MPNHLPSINNLLGGKMKSNKEIVTEIIEDLENTLGLNWPTVWNAKVTRGKLIECWSEYRLETDSKYFNYIGKGTTSRSYINIFKNINKVSQNSWKSCILELYNYKYCSICKKLLKIIEFSPSENRCKKCNSIRKQEYYIKNTEKIALYNKEYRENNRDYYKNWKKVNKDKVNASTRYRQAAKIKRTPSWLTEKDKLMMQEFYSLAKEKEKCTGIKWHVDHIIPLQGKLVSGLHVPINLQVITAKDNLSKSNKYQEK